MLYVCSVIKNTISMSQNLVYFETITKRDLVEMFNKEEISERCLDTVTSRLIFLKSNEYSLIDLGAFIAIVFDAGRETERVEHVNKFIR